MNEAAPAPGSSRNSAYAILAVVAAYLVLLTLLSRPTGGLQGRYAVVGPDGSEIPVHQRVDPAIDFPVPQRLDAAYIFNWDYSGGLFPSEKPPYLIHWSGLLRVPENGVYGFALEAQGEVAFSVAGRPLEIRPDALTEVELAAGLQPVRLDYRLSQGEPRLVLRWKPPGRKVHVIGPSEMTPDRDALVRGRTRARWRWVLMLLGGAGVVLLAVGSRRPASRVARWVAGLAPERSTLALGVILILAAFLRFHDYSLVPFHHETADEYQHAWEGWHLVHERTPAAWTTFPHLYPMSQVNDFRWFGDRYVLVHPYFDHPPLYSILVGVVCSLSGAQQFLACTLPVMRIVPILLSLVGLLLLYRLALAYGASERAALLGALVYATLPPIVLVHRLVKGESLLVLFFVGALLAVDYVERSGGRRGAVLTGMLCGLAIWTKATGVAVLATVLILLLARRRYRSAVVATAITLGGVGLYLAYAWAYDFDIFLQVLKAQATSKWVALDSIHDLLGGKVVVKWFGRGWYLWLLLATGMAALRKERRLLLPVAIYATLIALTADHRVIYGWYRIPLYPFFCVAAGLYLDRMIRKADLYHAFPFAATAVASGMLYALPEAVVRSKGAVTLFALLALGPFVARMVIDRPLARRLARAGAYLLVLLFLFTSVATVKGILEIYTATRGMQ